MAKAIQHDALLRSARGRAPAPQMHRFFGRLTASAVSATSE